MKSLGSIGTLEVNASVLAKRKMRFQDELVGDTNVSPKHNFKNNLSPTRIKGKCEELEKGYLRLTEAADANKIRPLPILKQALDMVKQKYLENEDYAYACDQLKSIRQDLTVQNIKGRFCAHVYETHGRIALEQGDLSEYQACQVRLQEMRQAGTKICYDEFTCYRLLYSLHVGSKLELQSVLSDVEREKRESMTHTAREASGDPASSTAFALEVIKAVRASNTNKFFSLYKNAIKHSQSVYILDYLLEGMRVVATEAIVKAFQTFPIAEYTTQLSFHDRSTALRFLKGHNVVVREGTAPEGCQGEVVVDGVATRASRAESFQAAEKVQRKLEKKKRKKDEKEKQRASGSGGSSILDRVGMGANSTPVSKKRKGSYGDIHESTGIPAAYTSNLSILNRIGGTSHETTKKTNKGHSSNSYSIKKSKKK